MKSRLFLLAFNIENMLKINNLHASVDSTEILKGINLEINDGEVHAIMGPTGSGKSTLANVLMGNPVYEITKGNIEFNGEDVTEDPVDVRAKKGMFLAFQYPESIPGVTIVNMLKTALTNIEETEYTVVELRLKVADAMKPGSHGSTFGGNPLGMAVASSVLDHILNKEFLDNVFSVGEYIKDQFSENIVKKFPKLVRGIRGKGLMLGIEAIANNEILIKEMINQKILVVKAGQNVIRMLPPLILEKKHVDEAIKKISKAFEKVNEEN